jgi:hypothetical protein
MSSAPLRPEAFVGVALTANGSPRMPAAMWISATEICFPPSHPFISAASAFFTLLETTMNIESLHFLQFIMRSPSISSQGALLVALFPDPPFSGQDPK